MRPAVVYRRLLGLVKAEHSTGLSDPYRANLGPGRGGACLNYTRLPRVRKPSAAMEKASKSTTNAIGGQNWEPGAALRLRFVVTWTWEAPVVGGVATLVIACECLFVATKICGCAARLLCRKRFFGHAFVAWPTRTVPVDFRPTRHEERRIISRSGWHRECLRTVLLARR